VIKSRISGARGEKILKINSPGTCRSPSPRMERGKGRNEGLGFAAMMVLGSYREIVPWFEAAKENRGIARRARGD